MKISLRIATLGDAQTVWHIRNDNAVRNSSRNSEIIEPDSHLTWYRSRIMDIKVQPIHLFYVGNLCIGYIRFDLVDINNPSYEISIALAPYARGKGYGTEMIRLSLQEIFIIEPNAIIRAQVKESNLASIKLFESNGFDMVNFDSGFRNYIIRGLGNFSD